MANEPERQRVALCMARINRAWLDCRVHELEALVHPDIVMALPGFAGRVTGRDAFLAGFQQFCDGATIHDFALHEEEIDLIAESAIVTFRYTLLYERGGERYRATGRDVWVFQKSFDEWLAVWRTMLDLDEEAA